MLQGKVKKAKLFHEKAVRKYDEAMVKSVNDKDALCALDALKSSSQASINLASEIEEQYGNEVINLHKYKDLTTFSAKHRDFVIQFEGMVFVSFRRMIPKGISPEVASAVASKDSVLSTLGILLLAEGRMDKNADDRAFVEDFRWVKKTWQDAVVARGLSYSDYQAVRDFKQNTNKAFHDADSPADALLVLESQVPVPAEVQKYKGPLTALLKLLAAQ